MSYHSRQDGYSKQIRLILTIDKNILFDSKDCDLLAASGASGHLGGKQRISSKTFYLWEICKFLKIKMSVVIGDYLENYNKAKKNGVCKSCNKPVKWSLLGLQSHKRASCSDEGKQVFFEKMSRLGMFITRPGFSVNRIYLPSTEHLNGVSGHKEISISYSIQTKHFVYQLMRLFQPHSLDFIHEKIVNKSESKIIFSEKYINSS